jgi:hypothetical protein
MFPYADLHRQSRRDAERGFDWTGIPDISI